MTQSWTLCNGNGRGEIPAHSFNLKKKIMTPKEFDKLIKVDYKKFDTGGRNQRLNVLVVAFFQTAFFLLSLLAIYIIGALLF